MYGVGGRDLLWFKSYRKQRMQIVKIKIFHSYCLRLKLSVPQGSILGLSLSHFISMTFPWFVMSSFRDDTKKIEMVNYK